MMYRFVEREKANHPVATMCRVLEVSPSGYWAWSKRPPSVRACSDAVLTTTIRDIHARSRGTYGVPRVHAELRDTGTRCSRKRVARLMRAAGLEGVHRRRSVHTTVQDRDAAPAPDLVERLLRASCPDVLWVADITYVPTWQGFLYGLAIGTIDPPRTRDHLGSDPSGDFALISSELDGEARTAWVRVGAVSDIRQAAVPPTDCTEAVAAERERVKAAAITAIEAM